MQRVPDILGCGFRVSSTESKDRDLILDRLNGAECEERPQRFKPGRENEHLRFLIA